MCVAKYPDYIHPYTLDNVLTHPLQAVTVDPTGRISVTEFTSSLEDAIVTEGKTNNCEWLNLHENELRKFIM